MSHHKKINSRHGKDLYQMIIDGKMEWFQAGPAPEWSGSPNPPYDERWNKTTSTIVVQIAALRETRCGDTLWHFLTKAKYPERVLFVVIQQNAAEDKDCMEQMCEKFGFPITKNADGEFEKGECPYFDQVTMKRLTVEQAKGPIYARGLAN